MTQSYAQGQDGGFAERVRCLECGQLYEKPSRGGISATNPGCPRCGYVGWVPVTREAGPTRSGEGPQLRRLR